MQVIVGSIRPDFFKHFLKKLLGIHRVAQECAAPANMGSRKMRCSAFEGDGTSFRDAQHCGGIDFILAIAGRIHLGDRG